MFPSLRGRPLRAALILLALGATTASTASAKSHHDTERVVVRGTDVVAEGSCDATGCELPLTDGAFRGTLGTGGYTGTIKLQLPDAYPNGEGGLCAPVKGRIVLGAGSPDRLALAIAGDSCQDGAGPVNQASFTGLADWTVVYGTGAYAHARGHGTGTFVEGADDREQMTMIGRIAR